MCVLGIINRIIIGLGHSQIKVKIHMSVSTSHCEEIADCIESNLVHKVTHGNSFSCPFTHLHLLLDDFDFKGILAIAKRLDGSLHTRDIAVVIGAPDIDKLFEAALKLVFMVGDIRRQIRVRSVILDKHAIFIIAEFG
ncbi:Uncharacterised protein [Mycobacteroides abscessus subsp. abscessus]|nr:Uncharacterised protein [Mycobacteroides abscessus subsp. abscessus]